MRDFLCNKYAVNAVDAVMGRYRTETALLVVPHVRHIQANHKRGKGPDVQSTSSTRRCTVALPTSVVVITSALLPQRVVGRGFCARMLVGLLVGLLGGVQNAA